MDGACVLLLQSTSFIIVIKKHLHESNIKPSQSRTKCIEVQSNYIHATAAVTLYDFKFKTHSELTHNEWTDFKVASVTGWNVFAPKELSFL